MFDVVGEHTHIKLPVAACGKIVPKKRSGCEREISLSKGYIPVPTPSLLHADYLYTDEHGPWVTSKLKNKQGHTT